MKEHCYKKMKQSYQDEVFFRKQAGFPFLLDTRLPIGNWKWQTLFICNFIFGFQFSVEFSIEFSVEFSVNRHPFVWGFSSDIKVKTLRIERFMEYELLKEITRTETRRSDHVLRIIHINIWFLSHPFMNFIFHLIWINQQCIKVKYDVMVQADVRLRWVGQFLIINLHNLNSLNIILFKFYALKKNIWISLYTLTSFTAFTSTFHFKMVSSNKRIFFIFLGIRTLFLLDTDKN